MDNGRLAGAVAGGVVAGLALSTVMLLGERASGKPSELIELERSTAAKLDVSTLQGEEDATLSEQLVTHSGHLALSALAGLAYAGAVPDEYDDLAHGALFGAAFFIAAYGITGPALGVTPLPWRQRPLRAVQHPVVHVLFGITMALSASAARRRRRGEVASG